MNRILIGFMIDGVGGVDKYILNVLEWIKGCNVKVDILTQYKNEKLKSILDKFPNVTIIEVDSLKHPIKQFRDFCKIFRQNHYEVIYLNISEATNSIGALVARIYRVKKVIIHSHSSGIDIASNVYRRIRKFIHIIFKNTIIRACTTHYFACSNKAAYWLYPANVVDKGMVKTIFNYVDLEKYKYSERVRDEVRKELGIENNKVFGTVGNYCYPKNNEFFIEIMKEFVKQDKSIVFISVGEGITLESVKQKAEESGMIERMYFLGQRDDVHRVLQAMDVFILPSRFEGLPFSALEAQAAGLKCILSNNITKETSITENCYFLEGFNANEWSKIIERMFKYSRENVELGKYKAKCENSKDFLVNTLLGE